MCVVRYGGLGLPHDAQTRAGIDAGPFTIFFLLASCELDLFSCFSSMDNFYVCVFGVACYVDCIYCVTSMIASLCIKNEALIELA